MIKCCNLRSYKLVLECSILFIFFDYFGSFLVFTFSRIKLASFKRFDTDLLHQIYHQTNRISLFSDLISSAEWPPLIINNGFFIKLGPVVAMLLFRVLYKLWFISFFSFLQWRFAQIRRLTFSRRLKSYSIMSKIYAAGQMRTT